MKLLILLGIRLYWLAIPPHRRRTCLFKQSCSRHVFDTTKRRGALAGINALCERVRSCRPGYLLLGTRASDGSPLLRLADGGVARWDALSDHAKAALAPDCH